jgi:hypothetical protein
MSDLATHRFKRKPTAALEPDSPSQVSVIILYSLHAQPELWSSASTCIRGQRSQHRQYQRCTPTEEFRQWRSQETTNTVSIARRFRGDHWNAKWISYLISAPPAYIQANAVEEVPGTLSPPGEQLREFYGETGDGLALGEVKGVKINGGAAGIEEFNWFGG